MPFRISFDWDPAKAETNRVKHGVSFDEAMTVFADPLALSRPDDDHAEERWITLGISETHRLVLVVHTHVDVSNEEAYIRIISARLPTKGERQQYEHLPTDTKDDMKDEYDFATAVRGRFHRPGTELVPPIHLDPEVMAYLSARAEANGMTLSQLVNDLLRKDIERIELAR